MCGVLRLSSFCISFPRRGLFFALLDGIVLDFVVTRSITCSNAVLH